jgi:hypothetical protein
VPDRCKPLQPSLASVFTRMAASGHGVPTRCDLLSRFAPWAFGRRAGQRAGAAPGGSLSYTRSLTLIATLHPALIAADSSR